MNKRANGEKYTPNSSYQHIPRSTAQYYDQNLNVALYRAFADVFKSSALDFNTKRDLNMIDARKIKAGNENRDRGDRVPRLSMMTKPTPRDMMSKAPDMGRTGVRIRRTFRSDSLTQP
ncbi:hypothetical protein PM082_016883 [Marasmius tenuissimus]|nr:hypothetical protein PM082_016883 [Marasmius tenuissimus]